MSMLLAMKVCRDKAPLNSMVAKLVSLSLKQFNIFESRYLLTLDFNLFISKSDYLEYSEILTSSADTQHEEQAMEPKVKTPTRCDHQNPILSRKRLKMSPPTSSIPITVKRPMHKVCTDMRSSGLYFTQEEITELRIDIASSANTDECLVSRSPSSTSSTPRSVVIS